jgi:hypothetical protein
MADQEVGFSDRLTRPNRLKIAAVAATSVAIIVAATLTMGASPTPPASGTASPSSPPSASGASPTPGWRGGPNALFGDFGGFGRHGLSGGGPARITIAAIDGSKVRLETADGWTRTITVTGTTEIAKGRQAATLADLHVGDQIHLRQSRASDGTYTIDAIEIVVPTVVGVVTAVDGGSVTVAERGGVSRTIATDTSTAYRFGRSAGARTDVVVGATILAQGTEDANGTFAATTIVVAPAHTAGTVKAKTATTITIERRDGTNVTVAVGGDTAYQVAGVANGGLDDVAVGMHIVASGRVGNDGSIAATDVRAGSGSRGFHGPWGGGPGHPVPSASPDGSTNDG